MLQAKLIPTLAGEGGQLAVAANPDPTLAGVACNYNPCLEGSDFFRLFVFCRLSEPFPR